MVSMSRYRPQACLAHAPLCSLPSPSLDCRSLALYNLVQARSGSNIFYGFIIAQFRFWRYPEGCRDDVIRYDRVREYVCVITRVN